jgi:hypothetical protein
LPSIDTRVAFGISSRNSSSRFPSSSRPNTCQALDETCFDEVGSADNDDGDILGHRTQRQGVGAAAHDD